MLIRPRITCGPLCWSIIPCKSFLSTLGSSEGHAGSETGQILVRGDIVTPTQSKQNDPVPWGMTGNVGGFNLSQNVLAMTGDMWIRPFALTWDRETGDDDGV